MSGGKKRKKQQPEEEENPYILAPPSAEKKRTWSEGRKRGKRQPAVDVVEPQARAEKGGIRMTFIFFNLANKAGRRKREKGGGPFISSDGWSINPRWGCRHSRGGEKGEAHDRPVAAGADGERGKKKIFCFLFLSFQEEGPYS